MNKRGMMLPCLFAAMALLFGVGTAKAVETAAGELAAPTISVDRTEINNGGTIILGGWTGERSEEITSGVPVLRNMPYIGKLLFSRAQRSSNKTTLMIFLTCYLVE